MASKINFILNDKELSIESATGKTLLDFIRKEAKLTGTKEGCREGDCGACTVIIGEIIDDELHYKTINSCLYPIGKVNGKHVVTIEGISSEELTPIQHAYVDENASQCGFCTPGFIMSTTGYLLENDETGMETALKAVAGNICRCTGYVSIKRALESIVDHTKFSDDENIITELINEKYIPEYFATIQSCLINLEKVVLEESSKTIIVSGGTDIYVQKEDDFKYKDPIIISGNSDNKIRKEGNNVFIERSSSFEEFGNSQIIQQIIPRIKEANQLIASLPIRNSATLAGNIVNASPIGDMTIILLALNATIHLTENEKKRKIFLREFFRGYKSIAKSESELIDNIELHLPEENSFFNFEKISKRTHLDIASVNSAINVKLEDGQIRSCGLSFGGVSPIPLFMSKTSSYLEGKRLSGETLNNALKLIDDEITPISDIRGSAEYKRLLAKQIFKSHFIKLFPDIITMNSFK